MVKVSWENETGKLVSVAPGDGPGEFSTGGDSTLIEERLRQVDYISERTIVSTLLSSYQGPIPERELIATAESYSNRTDEAIKTTIAFLEPATIDAKLLRIECSNCGYSPESCSSWDAQDRTGEKYEYRDWTCPECSQVVHTDVRE